MIKDVTTKELFELVRNTDTSGLPSLKTVLGNHEFRKYSIEELLAEMKLNYRSILLIDARSEKEFEESPLPHAVNFPVLTVNERHNVGLIYKNYSKSSALWLALEYAAPKSEALSDFLRENNAESKNIIVYCWRGGGRSGYLSKMIYDAGYIPSVLTGGYKSYRQTVNRFFSGKEFPYRLLELSGFTGCGKSELLRSVSQEIPVIDLEFSAKHFSSLLGHIPYEIRNFPPVASQSAFENDLYSQIYFNQDKSSSPLYLTESESRRIGRMEMPEIIYNSLQKSPSVKIICSLENRIRRIVDDYFGKHMAGILPMIKIMKAKEVFFRQQLSGKVYDELINLLENGRVNEFTEIMIVKYYDLKYRDKSKIPETVISMDNKDEAKLNLKDFYGKFKGRK